MVSAVMGDGSEAVRRQSCSEGGVRRSASARSAAAQEDDIAAAYDSIDRALKTNRARSRLVSAVILAIGLLAVLAFYFTPTHRRQRAAGHLRPGDDSSAVLARVGGEPMRCPGTDVDHVVAELPAGTSRPERAAVLALARSATRSRWVYPAGHGCHPRAGDSEVGFDAQGRVLWVAPAIGRAPLAYPDTVGS